MYLLKANNKYTKSYSKNKPGKYITQIICMVGQ